MNKIPYKTAIKLKEIGFNEPCDHYYHIYDDELDSELSLEATGNDCSDFFNSLNKFRCAAPTINQISEWLRDNKNIFIIPYIADDTEKPLTYEIYNNTECILTHHGNYFSLNEWNKCILHAIDFIIDHKLI